MAGELEGHEDLVNKVIWENEDKLIQYRFSITEFRGKHYVSIREWVLGFELDWIPTHNGVTLPYTLDTCGNLFYALTEVLAEAEVLEEVYSHFKNKEGLPDAEVSEKGG